MNGSEIKDLRPTGLAALILIFILAGLACHGCAEDGNCSACERGQSDVLSANVTETEGLNYSTSDIEHPIMRLPLEVILNEQKADKKLSKALVSLGMKAIPPGSYSLLDHLTYMPSERDQGRCGDCWVWASTGALELDLAYSREINDRLSIQYFQSNYQDGIGSNWACCGGFPTWFASFYTQNEKAVPWSNTNAGFYDGSRRCEDGSSSVPADSIETSPNYPLASIVPLLIPTHQDQDEEFVSDEEAIANIKGALRSNKGVIFVYFLDDFDPFFNFWKWESEDAVWTPSPGKSYSEGENPGGHAVLCVGYDDTDPANRYWIMLNSWGAPFNRPNGLFRMNMDMDYSYVYKEGLKAFGFLTFDVLYSDMPQVPSQLSGPTIGSVGFPYSYKTSSQAQDGEKLKYTFDWDDETTSETDFLDPGSEAEASHTWDAAGTYQINAMATNSQGSSSGWSQALDVIIYDNNPPYNPSRPYGSRRGVAGRSYSYSASSKDPDGDQLQYEFDWGDGTATTTPFVSSGRRASASHAWANAGIYQVSVMAVDSKGASSGWTATLVDIA